MKTLFDPISSRSLINTQSWGALKKASQSISTKSLAQLFKENPQRINSLHFSAAGINADLSRQLIDNQSLSTLLELGREMLLPSAIETLNTNTSINFTEKRSALHYLLRAKKTDSLESEQIFTCKQQMQTICNSIHCGEWKSHHGQTITDIVNIGIGGSDLGPRMAAEALTPYHNNKLRIHFAANIDPTDLEQTLRSLNPSTTLFIVTSKSWTTIETLTNAETAKQWFIEGTGQSDISQHFIAISSQVARCKEFGIAPEHILPMWDWVGGRYSMWSAVGLVIALATSFETFEALLQGAANMDQHFFSSPLESNLPAILALLEVWYVNFWGCESVAVLPYDHSLRLLPEHLQQLTMESNGKRVDRSGHYIHYATAPVLWGSAGTIGQHSFHQLLHQGTHIIPVDFILPLSTHSKETTQHQQMIANCLAQAETLMDGQSAESLIESLIAEGHSTEEATLLAQHKAMPGNRPSSIFTVDKLSPETLGALVAMYEHKTFCSSIIWNINAFDQWGVELGKKASATIYKALENKNSNEINNPATRAAVAEYFSKASS